MVMRLRETERQKNKKRRKRRYGPKIENGLDSRLSGGGRRQALGTNCRKKSRDVQVTGRARRKKLPG